MFGPPSIISFIRKNLKLSDNIWKVLHTDIYDGIPWLLVFIWTCFGLDTQRGNKPFYWSYQIIFWLWRCDSHLFQTVKIKQDVKGDTIITNLDLYVFPKIETTTIFHVHSWELTKCELFLTCGLLITEHFTSGATMINRRWCYNW